ncbi:MAG TPA: preprotein translocase subunit YajC [Gemmataceae bacterium]|nr:preprotein translocase subunit YajC [Gemmataceae bacterium]
MLFALLLLLAEAPPAEQPAPPAANPLATILNFAPFLAIGVLAWWLLIRPMKKQEQERKLLLSALKKNDRVVTSGGIIGIVANLKDKDDEVTLKVDESSNVRLRVTRASIVKILGGEEQDKEQKEGGA